MPLFIRDQQVADMAEELVRLKKARSKTEVVRDALREELERTRATLSPEEWLADIHEKAAKIGLPYHDFDTKAFLDEMWDDD